MSSLCGLADSCQAGRLICHPNIRRPVLIQVPPDCLGRFTASCDDSEVGFRIAVMAVNSNPLCSTPSCRCLATILRQPCHAMLTHCMCLCRSGRHAAHAWPPRPIRLAAPSAPHDGPPPASHDAAHGKPCDLILMVLPKHASLCCFCRYLPIVLLLAPSSDTSRGCMMLHIWAVPLLKSSFA